PIGIHERDVRELLAAGTSKRARDWALVKAATYGDAWTCWMLRGAGVSAKAITEARRQAKKYQEEGVVAVLKRGDVEEPPVRRPARFDIYFAKSGRKRDALINEIARAYGAAVEGHEDADQLIAEVRVLGESAAVSQMLDVEVGDRDTAREIAVRWMRGGGIAPLLGTRTGWELDEAVAWREAIRVGRY
ncbi:MAG: hypothetical protein KGK35_09270, partial [Xanthomonadaceae bacterium]|nr:hypothetical protein [Xanthomonadaceae bacterium]